MTLCPTCGRRYAPDVRFCAYDGAALVAAAPEEVPEPAEEPAPGPAGRASAADLLGTLLAQEAPSTVPVRASPSGAGADTSPPVPSLRSPAAPGPRASGPPATDEPPLRAARYAQPLPAGGPGETFGSPARPPAADAGGHSPEDEAAPTARRSRVVWMALGVAAVLLVGGFAASRLVFGPQSLEREAMDAIERGDLVTPSRVSAYDFALRLAERHPGSGAAERVGAEAFPLVVGAMDAFYARFYTTSEGSSAEWARTARLAEWATAIAPDDAHVRARAEYARARLAARGGDDAAVRAAYERAAAAWPEWALPPNSLGVLLARQGDTDGAERQYREAARLDPAWPFPLANLGSLYLRLERYDAAVDALARAVAADPDRPYPHVMLARAHAGAGDLDAARAEAREALRRDPTGETGFDARRLREDAAGWQRQEEAERQDALRRERPDQPADDDGDDARTLDDVLGRLDEVLP